jgi:hypothetical protein
MMVRAGAPAASPLIHSVVALLVMHVGYLAAALLLMGLFHHIAANGTIFCTTALGLMLFVMLVSVSHINGLLVRR